MLNSKRLSKNVRVSYVAHLIMVCFFKKTRKTVLPALEKKNDITGMKLKT